MRTVSIFYLHLLILILCPGDSKQAHSAAFWECIADVHIGGYGGDIRFANFTLKEKENWLHYRNDTIGENCAVLKMLFHHTLHVVFDMYPPGDPHLHELIVARLHDPSFFHQTLMLLKDSAPSEAGEKVEIEISDVDILSFYQSEWTQKMHLRFSAEASWTDERLKWDDEHKNFFNLQDVKTIKIYPWHIWVPDFASKWATNERSRRNAALRPVVNRKGRVKMHLAMYVAGNCPMNYRDFPKDQHDCCVYIESTKYPDKITYRLKDRSTVRQHTKGHFPAWWKLKKLNKSTDYEATYPRVKICLTLQRYGTIFMYKVVLPLGAATFLAIIIPFFTTWKVQVGTKLFSICLMFFAVMYTTDENIGLGPTVPRFVQMYDFLIWTTIVSVTLTIILWGLTFQTRMSPPPPMLTLTSGVINPIFRWTYPTANAYISFDGPKGEDGEAGSSSTANQVKNYNSDWNAVYLAINNILLILFTFTYIVGLIVCAT